MGKAASPIRAFRQLHHKTPLGKITSHLSFAEHYFLTKTAEVSMFPFQVGVIQMAADKTMLKKKINQIKGCTQELMFIANKNKNREREREERRWSEAQHIRLRI